MAVAEATEEERRAVEAVQTFYVRHRNDRFFSSSKYPGTSRAERTLGYSDLLEVARLAARAEP